METLATPTQLGLYIQETIAENDPSALLYLDIASGMVRDYLQLILDPVTDDVVELDPIDGSYVFLPELPVTSVSLVETFDGSAWSTVDSVNYTVSTRLGIIAGLPNQGIVWPSNPGTWRVTYSHGFAPLPSSILGVVLGVAGRAYSTPAGIDLERIGGYQVKYAMEADGFSAIEKKALARYVNPRIA
jgi:hypothetical protein